ncbi:MAG: NUDIX hydrolase [Symbiobacteriaceae bacterium]|nr:NUDIX hydrolase [Symbiobacteriaceae bacterium]
MKDILFRTENYIFSYRVAGIMLQDNAILLQRTSDDSGYAVPGGHAELGETNAETLVREYKEEIGVDITVGALKWVAEIHFAWQGTPCHQICLYYEVFPQDLAQIPLEGTFTGTEEDGVRRSDIIFSWIPLANLHQLKVYPENMAALMAKYETGVQHLVSKE